jgi:hypothetical protein
MDSMGVSEALDSGSIPDEATSKTLGLRLRVLSLIVLEYSKSLKLPWLGLLPNEKLANNFR